MLKSEKMLVCRQCASKLDGGKQNQLESGSHKKSLGLKVRLLVYISTVL